MSHFCVDCCKVESVSKMKKGIALLLSVLMATSSATAPTDKTDEEAANDKEKVMNAYVYSQGIMDKDGNKIFDIVDEKNKTSSSVKPPCNKKPQPSFRCSVLDSSMECQEAKDRVRMFIYTCIKIILVVYVGVSQIFPVIDVAAPEFLTAAAVLTLGFKYLF